MAGWGFDAGTGPDPDTFRVTFARLRYGEQKFFLSFRADDSWVWEEIV